MSSHDRLLVLPADVTNSPEFVPTADVASEDIPDWIETRLRSTNLHCKPLGKTLIAWCARDSRSGTLNQRAFALWYGYFGGHTGTVAPVPPEFIGDVVFEASDANLPTDRIQGFLAAEATRAFFFRGNSPRIDEIRPLVEAWRTGRSPDTP
jgi:hypothetical protein